MRVRQYVEFAAGFALLVTAVLITVMGDSVLASPLAEGSPSPHPSAVVAPASNPDTHEQVRLQGTVPADPVAFPRADDGLQGTVPADPIAFPGADDGEVATLAEPVRPERIRIPRLGVDTSVIAVDLRASGALDPPSDPQVLGWWAGGALPGASRGTAVVAGHVNTASSGPGALFHLGDLEPGDKIVVAGADRTLTFRVVRLEQHRKSQLPASTAFSQSGKGRLAIVSCGGPFNARTGSYRDNIIAYAVPV